MNKAILITGVSGCGKSAVCEKLNELGYKALDIEDIDGLFQMVHKKTGEQAVDYNNYDFEKVKEHTWACDEEKLKNLIKENSGIVFYCGIGSNTINWFSFFDKVFLLKANEENTRKRLTHRTSNDFGRTEEIQDWIFEWKEDWENKMQEKGALVIDANRSLKEIVDEIIGRI